jgi:glycosyltransferase involved in cell wall biosynthesis
MTAEAPARRASWKLSIIIPVYNEEQTISELVERVRAVDLGALEKEIIIANDGSSDRTRDVINSSEWVRDPRIRIYDYPINVGKVRRCAWA